MLFDVVRLGPLDRDLAVPLCVQLHKKRRGSKGFTAREQMTSIIDEWNRGVTSLALV